MELIQISPGDIKSNLDKNNAHRYKNVVEKFLHSSQLCNENERPFKSFIYAHC